MNYMNAESSRFGPPSYFPETPDERELQSRIETEEASFLEFGKSRLLPLIERMPMNNRQQQSMKATMPVPFHVVQNNKNNPLRNAMAVKRVSEEQARGAQDMNGYALFSAQMLQMPDALHFGYDYLPDEHQTTFAAAFAPIIRTMLLPRSQQPSNVLAELIKFHELIHVMQESRRRSIDVMSLEQYIGFHVPKAGDREKKVVLDDDVQAYNIEVEALNMLVNGKLQAEGANGNVCDEAEIMQELEIPEHYSTPTKLLLWLAREYYGNYRGDGVIPNEFTQAVIRVLRHDSHTPYRIRDGVPHRVG